VLVAPRQDCHAIRRHLEAMLTQRFHIGHTTLQVDHAHDPFVSITSRAEAEARRDSR
jgi:cobalt-zinc-cadmium efflux system protein